MVATLEAIVRLRDEMSAKLDALDKKVGKSGGGMQGLGKTMLGTAGGFLAAQASMATLEAGLTKTVGAAAAFDGQMAQIRALTGATKDDTDKLQKSILKMTETLPKTPQELGAGAYFTLSSGIKDTATATKVLELAAKASVVGLGDTKTVADALTSVMNAYQLSVEDAGRATDTLVNIVKFGKGEPAELAESLGFVIPVAAQMGIEFEQVGAVMATLTNTGLGAAESVTALRGIMLQILSPSDEAKKKFAELGINLEEFRAQIDDDFVGAMGRLVEATGGSETAIAELFPEVRGMVGVMAAFGNQADQTRANLEGITEGTGALEEGFGEVSATAKFKYEKAMNDLNVALMRLGTEALPAVAAGAVFAADALNTLTVAMKAIDDVTSLVGVDLPGAITDSIPVISQFKSAADFKAVLEGDIDRLDDFVLRMTNTKLVTDSVVDVAGKATSGFGLFGGGAEKASAGLDAYTLSVQQAQVLQADLIASGEDLAGVVGGLSAPVDDASGAIGGLGDAAGSTDTKVSDLYKSIRDLAAKGIAAILPTVQEFSLLGDTMVDNAEATAQWDERVAKLQSNLTEAVADQGAAAAKWADHLEDMQFELGQLEAKLATAMDPEDVQRLTRRMGDLREEIALGPPDMERLTQRIGDLQTEIARAPDNIPPVLSGFEQWRERVGGLADDYRALDGNMKTIMDSLVDQHVTGVGDIMAVLREHGPEFAADFAQWFRDDPIAAATTLKDVMPGIMSEAANTAINNVLAATSRFNEEWQKNVIDALNAIPEPKRIEITSTISPDFWLQVALIEKTIQELGQAANIGDLAEAAGFPPSSFGQRAIGGARGWHGEVDRPTVFIAGEGGRREHVDITPEHAGIVALAPRGSGSGRGMGGAGGEGGATVNQEIHLNAGIGVDRGALKQAVREMWPELQREAARGW